MRLLIVTPLVPPEPGGPSYYAVALKEALERAGHYIGLIAFKEVRHLPSGVRHLLFFYKVLFRAMPADALIVLDTVSVALPAVFAGWLLGKKIVVRTGGDFVWETYIERTKEKILFKDFYTAPRALSRKERMLVFLQKHAVLRFATHVAYNTALQRDVWRDAYGVSDSKTSVLENSMPKKERPHKGGKEFVCAWRPTAFKNIDTLEAAIAEAQKTCPELRVDLMRDVPREELHLRLRNARALIIPSLTEFGPNMALEALAMSVPVLLTRECGIYDVLDGHVEWIDPLSVSDLASALCRLMDKKKYAEAQDRARSFTRVRSYDDVARDFLALLEEK